jgi:hypothetical protein
MSDNDAEVRAAVEGPERTRAGSLAPIDAADSRCYATRTFDGGAFNCGGRVLPGSLELPSPIKPRL